MSNLKALYLASNPLWPPIGQIVELDGVNDYYSYHTFAGRVITMDLSFTLVNSSWMSEPPMIQAEFVTTLNMSHCSLNAISSFSKFWRLQVLDLRGNDIEYFPKDTFSGKKL